MNLSKLVSDRHQALMLLILVTLLLIFSVFSIASYANRNKNEDGSEEPAEKIETIKINYAKIEKISGKYYYEDENYTSLFGIDVSTFQEHIDWKKVKEDGVEFAFIRVGRRGATSGLLYDDDLFEENYKGAKENGIKVGVYFFSQAIDEKEAIEEANFVLDRIRDKQLDLPVVYDCEEVVLEDEVNRIADLDKKTLTDNTLTFLQEIEKHGYQGMVYTYAYWADTYYEMDRISQYPIWFALYDVDDPTQDFPITIWQYSNKGTINGISEPTDMDIMFIRKDNGK